MTSPVNLTGFAECIPVEKPEEDSELSDILSSDSDESSLDELKAQLEAEEEGEVLRRGTKNDTKTYSKRDEELERMFFYSIYVDQMPLKEKQKLIPQSSERFDTLEEYDKLTKTALHKQASKFVLDEIDEEKFNDILKTDINEDEGIEEIDGNISLQTMCERNFKALRMDGPSRRIALLFSYKPGDRPISYSFLHFMQLQKEHYPFISGVLLYYNTGYGIHIIEGSEYVILMHFPSFFKSECFKKITKCKVLAVEDLSSMKNFEQYSCYNGNPPKSTTELPQIAENFQQSQQYIQQLGSGLNVFLKFVYQDFPSVTDDNELPHSVESLLPANELLEFALSDKRWKPGLRDVRQWYDNLTEPSGETDNSGESYSIVSMRKDVRQAVVNQIHGLSKKINQLRTKKGTEEEKKKNENKAEAHVSEILILKKLKPDDISLYALSNPDESDLKAVIGKQIITIETRSMAKLCLKENLQKSVKGFISNYNESLELLNDLINERYDNTGKKKKRGKKQKASDENISDSSESVPTLVPLNKKKLTNIGLKPNKALKKPDLPVDDEDSENSIESAEDESPEEESAEEGSEVGETLGNLEDDNSSNPDEMEEYDSLAEGSSDDESDNENALNSPGSSDEESENNSDSFLKPNDFKGKNKIIKEKDNKAVSKTVDPFFMTKDNSEYITFGKIKPTIDNKQSSTDELHDASDMSEDEEDEEDSELSKGSESHIKRGGRGRGSFRGGNDRGSYRGSGERGSYRGGRGRESYGEGNERGSFRGGRGRGSFRGSGERGSFRGGRGRGSFRGSGERGSFRGGRGRSSSGEGDERGSFRGGRGRGSFRGSGERGSFRGGRGRGGFGEGGGRGTFRGGHNRGSFGEDNGSFRGGRGRGSFRGRNDREENNRGKRSWNDGENGNSSNKKIKFGNSKSPSADNSKLHPSWEAKKNINKGAVPFQGKKTVFDD